MAAREGPALLGSTLVRADGRSAMRMRHTRGFVLLAVQVKRLVTKGAKTGEWAKPKRPWRLAPPRGWEFASVAISDWSLTATGRERGALDQLGLSAALELGKDGKLDVWVQAVCGATPGVSWRGAVNAQVSIFGPAPLPTASSIRLPSEDLRGRRSRVPRAARGLRSAMTRDARSHRADRGRVDP